MAQMSATVLSMFENDKILCLSDIRDSILMWSYYTENHAGMVLRFTDVTPNNPLTRAQREDVVTYTKSSHWSHEREWVAEPTARLSTFPLTPRSLMA
jgi:hypothetical protein